jgi:nitrogen-specific signal transduction histidine kinase
MESHANAPQWLAATLSAEMLITSLTSGAEQIIDYSAQELVGRPITHILADPSVIALPQILHAVKEWGHWEGEMVHRARGGGFTKARSMMTLLAGNGNLESVYLLISNLNEPSDFGECEIPALTEVAANLRTLAHDLNNPLAVIMGFTQLLVLDTNCQGRIRGDIEKIYSELKRVAQAVERLHGYALTLYKKQKPGRDSDPSVRYA